MTSTLPRTGRKAPKGVDEWRDDGQRDGGEAPVEDRHVACFEAESEYHAIDTATADGLGVQSLLSDLEAKAEVRTWTDSNATDGVEKGCEKTRHIELRYLMTSSGRVKIRRVLRESNSADHLTKGRASLSG